MVPVAELYAGAGGGHAEDRIRAGVLNAISVDARAASDVGNTVRKSGEILPSNAGKFVTRLVYFLTIASPASRVP
jgi:hypothetical protein